MKNLIVQALPVLDCAIVLVWVKQIRFVALVLLPAKRHVGWPVETVLCTVKAIVHFGVIIVVKIIVKLIVRLGAVKLVTKHAIQVVLLVRDSVDQDAAKNVLVVVKMDA